MEEGVRITPAIEDILRTPPTGDAVQDHAKHFGVGDGLSGEERGFLHVGIVEVEAGDIERRGDDDGLGAGDVAGKVPIELAESSGVTEIGLDVGVEQRIQAWRRRRPRWEPSTVLVRVRAGKATRFSGRARSLRAGALGKRHARRAAPRNCSPVRDRQPENQAGDRSGREARARTRAATPRHTRVKNSDAAKGMASRSN